MVIYNTDSSRSERLNGYYEQPQCTPWGFWGKSQSEWVVSFNKCCLEIRLTMSAGSLSSKLKLSSITCQSFTASKKKPDEDGVEIASTTVI